MQQQPNPFISQQQQQPQQQQQQNPLLFQSPTLPDVHLLQVCPPMSYPHPPSHYKQQHFEPPDLHFIRQYTEGFSSFGNHPQGIKITRWTEFGDREFKLYDKNIKEKLHNINNTIYRNMKTVLELGSEESNCEKLRQLTGQIQRNVVEFYSLTKAIKEFQIRKSLFEKCKEETKKYDQLSTKYKKIGSDTLERLYRFTMSTPVADIFDQ